MKTLGTKSAKMAKLTVIGNSQGHNSTVYRCLMMLNCPLQNGLLLSGSYVLNSEKVPMMGETKTKQQNKDKPNIIKIINNDIYTLLSLINFKKLTKKSNKQITTQKNTQTQCSCTTYFFKSYINQVTSLFFHYYPTIAIKMSEYDQPMPDANQLIRERSPSPYRPAPDSPPYYPRSPPYRPQTPQNIDQNQQEEEKEQPQESLQDETSQPVEQLRLPPPPRRKILQEYDSWWPGNISIHNFIEKINQKLKSEKNNVDIKKLNEYTHTINGEEVIEESILIISYSTLATKILDKLKEIEVEGNSIKIHQKIENKEKFIIKTIIKVNPYYKSQINNKKLKSNFKTLKSIIDVHFYQHESVNYVPIGLVTYSQVQVDNLIGVLKKNPIVFDTHDHLNKPRDHSSKKIKVDNKWKTIFLKGKTNNNYNREKLKVKRKKMVIKYITLLTLFLIKFHNSSSYRRFFSNYNILTKSNTNNYIIKRYSPNTKNNDTKSNKRKYKVVAYHSECTTKNLKSTTRRSDYNLLCNGEIESWKRKAKKPKSNRKRTKSPKTILTNSNYNKLLIKTKYNINTKINKEKVNKLKIRLHLLNRHYKIISNKLVLVKGVVQLHNFIKLSEIFNNRKNSIKTINLLIANEINKFKTSEKEEKNHIKPYKTLNNFINNVATNKRPTNTKNQTQEIKQITALYLKIKNNNLINTETTKHQTSTKTKLYHTLNNNQINTNININIKNLNYSKHTTNNIQNTKKKPKKRKLEDINEKKKKKK